MASSLYATAHPDIVEEINRQAEARLEAQLTVALAADQRAFIFAGFLVAIVAALLAVTTSNTVNHFETVVLLLTSGGLLLAAGLAAWSAQPSAWEMVGNVPSGWLDDIANRTSLAECRAEMATHYEGMIKANQDTLEGAALTMRISLALTVVTMLVAGVVSAFALI
jgi:hypothetical protein